MQSTVYAASQCLFDRSRAAATFSDPSRSARRATRPQHPLLLLNRCRRGPRALYRIFEYNKARSSGYGREADDPLVTVLSHGGEERFVVLTLGAEYSRVWQQHREDVGTCNIVVYWEDPKSAPAAPYGLKWLVPTGARQLLPDVWLGRERTLAHLSREYKPVMDRVADVAATASWYREHGLVREHPCARGVGRIDLNDDRGRRLDARWGPH